MNRFAKNGGALRLFFQICAKNLREVQAPLGTALVILTNVTMLTGCCSHNIQLIVSIAVVF